MKHIITVVVILATQCWFNEATDELSQVKIPTCSGTSMTDDDRKNVLLAHNELRALLQAIESRNIVLFEESLPMSDNMNLLQFIIATVIVSLLWTFDKSVVNAKPDNNVIPIEAQLLTGDALVDYVNKNQQLFKAESAPALDELKMKIMKSKYINPKKKASVYETEDDGMKIPTSFDARTRWPYCPSISLIRDQSQCGSCWAVSSAGAMSDRVCIATQGNKTVNLSADDITTCCMECGKGCGGGWPFTAWKYFVESGVVTGGLYGTKDVCRPYKIPPCGVHPNQTFYVNCTGDVDTPPCKTECQPGYPISYNDDKTYGKTVYGVRGTVHAIQKDIMKFGPVVAAFYVFEDFMHYKSEIYKHTGGQELGGHAVRILGWGEENGVPYWLIANSWNTDWGENGYFRIRRGTDECGIESNVVAGKA